MNTLSLDPGMKCGWAVFDPDGIPIESGVWKLKLRDDERYGARGVRLKSLLEAKISAHQVTRIYYESVRNHAATGAAHVYGGLELVISMVAYAWDLPCEGLHVQWMKQVATGKGNAKKPAMIASAAKKWPSIRIIDDNHADALWIGYSGLRQLAGLLPPPKVKVRKKRVRKARNHRHLSAVTVESES